MVPFLLWLSVAFAQDADAVLDCDSTWYTANFNDLGADDDCTVYTDTGVCAQPIAADSPDMLFQFNSPLNVWVQVELGWGSRLAMNYYTTVDEPCGVAITCATGYWGGGGFAGVTWFSADANRDYFITFDNQGAAAGPPSYFAEISGLTCCYDDDGDGFFNPDDGCDRMPTAQQDCDDMNPENFPGNVEVCDGVDNDCDNAIDENASDTYYLDNDGDGYGDDSTAIVDCGAPNGYVDVGGDCNDNNPQVSPGVAELCNGFDDDCDSEIDEGFDSDGNGIPDCADQEVCDGVDNDGDGLIDDDDPDLLLSSAPTWYLDEDGDGHADPNKAVQSCAAPPNGLVTADDCDDNFATRHPGLAETCDGIDNDCDVRVDEGTECYDDDGDGFSERAGDCNDAQAAFNPAAEDICNGANEDCDGAVDEGTECTDDDNDGYCEGPQCSDGSTPGDCNDGSDLVSPSATEIDNNGIDDDCDGAVDTQVSDPDGDGYTAEAGDCDSTNAEVFPGANEVADGLDNDCDSSTDEGTAAGDDDGDGYCEGADLDGVGGPDCGDGSTPGDCNDTVTSVNLNGNEVPNEQDDDCDGIVDEGSSGVDDDLDGFTDDAGDCDDENREIFPGAEEIEDEIDNDCDGKIDEGFSDLDGDGVTTEDGDCDDDNGWVNPGQREVCGDGIDNNCDGEVDEGCGPEVIAPAPGGCGCSKAPSTFGGLLGSLMVLPWLRRRRMN